MTKTKERTDSDDTYGASRQRMDPVDSADIGKVIYTLDAYRNNIFYDVSWIDRLVDEGRLGRPFGNKWKSVRRDLFKMARVTSRVPGIARLAKIQSYTEAFWQISVPILFIMLFVGLFAPENPIIGIISPYVMILAFSALILGVLSRYIVGARIAKRINAYIEENPEVNVLRAKGLKDSIDILFDELRRFVIRNDLNPEDHLVGVELLDYPDIEVVKNPKPWRKYYLVKVEV